MVQLVEEGLIDDSRQRGANAACLHALLHNDSFASLLHALGDGLQVKGLETDQVNDLQVPRDKALGHRLYPDKRGCKARDC